MRKTSPSLNKPFDKPIKKHRLPPWVREATFIIGSVVVLAFLVISFFPQWFTSYDPIEIDATARLVPPSAAHPFGTDNYGRDILSRVLYGAKIDLFMGILGTIIPFVVGVVLGLLAGYYGGMLDSILMRVIDVLMALPFTILVIVIMTILGQGLQNVFIALWMVGWMAYAKLVRGEVMVLKNSDFIQAAVISGYSDKRVLLRHLLPNVISAAVVLAASDVVMCMLTGASMSYLGLGVQLPTPEWGAILNEGRSYISRAWWITLFPGLFMAVTGIGFSLLGDGLTDFLRAKGR
ncbi:nickel ABC transporter permease [Clostridia bacterium]|nr:nickel ABC transporter permease [Clostridia bacterium]